MTDAMKAKGWVQKKAQEYLHSSRRVEILVGFDDDKDVVIVRAHREDKILREVKTPEEYIDFEDGVRADRMIRGFIRSLPYPPPQESG